LDEWLLVQARLQKLIRFARQSPREKLASVRNRLGYWCWIAAAGKLGAAGQFCADSLAVWVASQTSAPPHLGNDRTAYVIGLFGTGRLYINELIGRNIGERAEYFFEERIRLHPGPTSMIYSGHATIRHVSRDQWLPSVTNRIFKAVGSGSADLIFIYRHPLDSLLSNWIFWRALVRDGTMGAEIERIYKNVDDLCADLEENFLDFKAFAEGDPDFFATVGGPRFLSFPEFVEETELYIEAATLPLRLEDFTIDPVKEFSKIAEVMSVDLDLSHLCLGPPRAKPYRYLAVKEKVPPFRDFINGLNAETKSRIEKIGYVL
jgi:hypothetical protein